MRYCFADIKRTATSFGGELVDIAIVAQHGQPVLAMSVLHMQYVAPWSWIRPSSDVRYGGVLTPLTRPECANARLRNVVDSHIVVAPQGRFTRLPGLCRATVESMIALYLLQAEPRPPASALDGALACRNAWMSADKTLDGVPVTGFSFRGREEYLLKDDYDALIGIVLAEALMVMYMRMTQPDRSEAFEAALSQRDAFANKVRDMSCQVWPIHLPAYK